jgi:quercetin dioxygenase-like cupin family protein
MAFRIVTPEQLEWTTRPHDPDEPARHVAELYERAAAPDVPANIWRYEPGARGRRHRHKTQTEVFVVLEGTLSMYLGDPPECHDVPTRGVVVVEPGTALQSANHGDVDLIVYAYGTPPEDERAELLE